MKNYIPNRRRDTRLFDELVANARAWIAWCKLTGYIHAAPAKRCRKILAQIDSTTKEKQQ